MVRNISLLKNRQIPEIWKVMNEHGISNISIPVAFLYQVLELHFLLLQQNV